MSSGEGLATIDLLALLVDPQRFSPRAVPVEIEQVEQLEAALAAGDELPPLRVAKVADAYADWCYLEGHHRKVDQAAWLAECQRRPWTNRPLQSHYVLVDGLARYWALRRTAEANGKPRRIEVACFVELEPVGSPAEVLARAQAANRKNGRRLTDQDYRTAFERLWLGRPVKESHESWKPGEGALAASDIAHLCGRSEAWVSKMKTAARVAYAIRYERGQPDLGLLKSTLLARLPESDWGRFALTTNDQPRLHYRIAESGAVRTDGGPVTLWEMTAAELELLVDLELRGVESPDEAAPPALSVADEAVAEGTAEPDTEHGQYVLEFELDLTGTASNVHRFASVVTRLPLPELHTRYVELQHLLAEATIAAELAAKRLKKAGYEV